MLPLPETAQYVPIRHAVREEMRSIWHHYRPPPVPPPIDVELASPSAASSPTRVRVATLVAMPSQEIDAEDLPYLEFGVLETDIMDQGRMSSQSDGDGGMGPEADLKV